LSSVFFIRGKFAVATFSYTSELFLDNISRSLYLTSTRIIFTVDGRNEAKREKSRAIAKAGMVVGDTEPNKHIFIARRPLIIFQLALSAIFFFYINLMWGKKMALNVNFEDN